MRANVLKPKDSIRGESATDSYPQPGDFPLGSPESRAAARAKVQRRTALSPYDKDCLILHLFAIHLCGHAEPDCKWMENTPFYIRGREIRDDLYGPIIPCHLDPDYARRTLASDYFELFNGRLPKPGDILRYEDLADLYGEEMVKAEVGWIQEAWARRLPETPCPFKYENGKMLIHQDDGSWKVDWSEDAFTCWNEVEDDAFERRRRLYDGVFSEPPTIHAVVFIDSKDKVRRVKPLEPECDSSTGGGQPAAVAATTKRSSNPE